MRAPEPILPTPRVEILEPLRGLAALAVAWFHFTNGSGFLAGGWVKASGQYGWLGVEFFFVISGFIIPYSLFQSGYRFPDHAGTFLLKRIVRLDPPYLVAIVLTVILAFLSAATPGFRGEPPSYEWVQLALHLGYLNAFFGYPWVIPVLWTLAIEFQFYLWMAVAAPAVMHRSWKVRLLAVAAFCGLSFLLPGEAFVFRFLGLFALGVLTFQRHVGQLGTRAYLMLVALATAATAAALGQEPAAAGLLAALAIAFVRAPRIAPLVFLGSISYSLYLLHTTIGGRVINLGSRWATGTASKMMVLALALAISIGAAYLLYHFVERPARNWSSSLRYRRRAAPAGVEAAAAPAASASQA